MNFSHLLNNFYVRFMLCGWAVGILVGCAFLAGRKTAPAPSQFWDKVVETVDADVALRRVDRNIQVWREDRLQKTLWPGDPDYPAADALLRHE